MMRARQLGSGQICTVGGRLVTIQAETEAGSAAATARARHASNHDQRRSGDEGGDDGRDVENEIISIFPSLNYPCARSWEKTPSPNGVSQ